MDELMAQWKHHDEIESEFQLHKGQIEAGLWFGRLDTLIEVILGISQDPKPATYRRNVVAGEEAVSREIAGLQIATFERDASQLNLLVPKLGTSSERSAWVAFSTAGTFHKILEEYGMRPQS